MAKVYTLHRELTIDTDIETAWDFIRRPSNLNAITPDDMVFDIVSEVPDEMYNGLMIEYRIGIPLIGKRVWVSEIKHVRDRRAFVDEQRVGPYKMWHHYHEILPVEGGVRFTDTVTYTLPFGPLGSLARAIYVKGQLDYIFDYRREAMERILGGTRKGAELATA